MWVEKEADERETFEERLIGNRKNWEMFEKIIKHLLISHS